MTESKCFNRDPVMHTSRCSLGGANYDPVSGSEHFLCGRKARWHIRPPSPYTCGHFCDKHMRYLAKSYRDLEGVTIELLPGVEPSSGLRKLFHF